MTAQRVERTAAAVLAAVAALHTLWGTGRSWPAPDRGRLAELVAGTDDRAAPAAIDPTSVPAEDDTPPPGRAAQIRGGLRG